jgi:hypothetical protein
MLLLPVQDNEYHTLHFSDGKEIAVAYFRVGYSPNDYYSEKVKT